MGCGASAGTTGSSYKVSKGQTRDGDKMTATAENQDFRRNMEFLSKVPLFKGLPRDEHPLLAMSCEKVSFRERDVIIRQHENGSEFFVIMSGEAVVSVLLPQTNETKTVAALKEGDYFGEVALLQDAPRNATITAQTELVALKITSAKFKELGLDARLQFPNRKAVGQGQRRKVETKPPSPKTEEEKAFIRKALENNHNLQAIVVLDDERINGMIDIAWKETIQAGTDIIKEGDVSADYFYVVQEGCFEIFVKSGSSNSYKEVTHIRTDKELGYLVQVTDVGGSFGELALLYLVPRAATVRAKEQSVVWVFDRHSFKEILMKVSAKRIKTYLSYLSRVHILDALLDNEKRSIAEALVDMHFTKDDAIIEEGEQVNSLYILYEGEFAVVKDGVEESRFSTTKSGEPRFFGEHALVSKEPQNATLKVVSSVAKALALDRESFDLLLGPLENIISRGTGAELKVKGADSITNQQSWRKRNERVKRKNLVKIGLLGCGGFGAVELWKDKTTDESYAMKVLNKGYIIKFGMQETVMNEKTILMMTNSPFIIRLYECYNGTTSLYFLMEPALGGELYSIYHLKGFYGSERHAKFYAAGVTLAFDHMHKRRIIYRDLKPENLLLDAKGKLMVTDMGLAKFVIGKTYTTCGTPDYFAPELVASSGHTNALDWWTLGVLIYEMMSGSAPFEAPTPLETYAKVVAGIGKVSFPSRVSGPVADLVKALLKKEPSERLPMHKGGIVNIKMHPWYAGFPWIDYEAIKMEPPYKPVVRNNTDIANFKAKKEDIPKPLEYIDDGSGWDKDFATDTSW